MTNYDPNRREEPEVLTPGEARQAPSGRPVLYVLIAGLALALFAWAAVELYPSAPDAPTRAEIEPTSPQIAREPLSAAKPGETTATVPPTTAPTTPAPETGAAATPPPAGSDAVTGDKPR